MLVWLLIASLAAQGWMLNGVALGWLLAKLCDCTLLTGGRRPRPLWSWPHWKRRGPHRSWRRLGAWTLWGRLPRKQADHSGTDSHKS